MEFGSGVGTCSTPERCTGGGWVDRSVFFFVVVNLQGAAIRYGRKSSFGRCGGNGQYIFMLRQAVGAGQESATPMDNQELRLSEDGGGDVHRMLFVTYCTPMHFRV